MAGVWRVVLWLPWVLFACVTDCDEQPTRIVGRVAAPSAIEPSAEPAPRTTAKPSATPKAVPEPRAPSRAGGVLGAEAFEPFAPDELAGYAASAPAERVEMALPGEHEVTALKRTYTRGGTTLRLELIDALHTPTPIQLVTKSQGTQRTMDAVRYDGQAIAGHPGLLQWNASEHSAKASVVLRGRYLVNVQIEPAKDTAEALRLAETLPLDRIAKLEPVAP